MQSPKLSFKGWNITEFIKGRKKLLVTAVGYVASYLVTQNPMLSAIIAAGAELAYAVIEYYAKEV